MVHEIFRKNENRINNEVKINYSQKISEVVTEYNSVVGERAKIAELDQWAEVSVLCDFE